MQYNRSGKRKFQNITVLSNRDNLTKKRTTPGNYKCFSQNLELKERDFWGNFEHIYENFSFPFVVRFCTDPQWYGIFCQCQRFRQKFWTLRKNALQNHPEGRSETCSRRYPYHIAGGISRRGPFELPRGSEKKHHDQSEDLRLSSHAGRCACSPFQKSSGKTQRLYVQGRQASGICP